MFRTFPGSLGSPSSLTSLIALLALLLMNDSIDAAEPVAGRQVAASSKTQVVTDWKYWLYLPEDYESKADARWPLMLFLHGAGERGPDLEKVKIHGPPKLVAQGKQFPFVIVAPQCKQGGWWDATELSGLLDTIEREYRIDDERIYVTGLSMGGYGTWSLAMRESRRFAAIAPICGGGNVLAAGYTQSIQVPTWCFHGAKDNVVPPSASQAMVDVLKAGKVEVIYTVYPDAGHDSWTETYNNPKLYEWLLSHRRVK